MNEAAQNFFSPAIAALIGFVLGWLWKHLAVRRRLDALAGRLMKEEAARAFARGELDRAREELARCRETRSEIEAARRDGARDEPPPKDDLKQIEGIGPKIEGLLHAAGIRTWEQLAGAPAAEVRQVLDQAGPRFQMHDPGTWGRQAGLAAAAKWDELRALQGRLKGGRET